MTAADRRQRAIDLWSRGQRHHLAGDLDRAIDFYSRSIAVLPTAEAHTFRGWAYGLLSRFDEAIAECKKAIALDPDFGNPYNDIGSYLVSQGKLDESIEWLERAKVARRYEPRHFPFMNLGRVYALKGMIRQALVEFHGALEHAPDEPGCLGAIEELERMLQ